MVLGMAISLEAQDQLEQAFRNPPSSAKPFTWWHWMNGHVSKEGITANHLTFQVIGSRIKPGYAEKGIVESALRLIQKVR